MSRCLARLNSFKGCTAPVLPLSCVVRPCRRPSSDAATPLSSDRTRAMTLPPSHRSDPAHRDHPASTPGDPADQTIPSGAHPNPAPQDTPPPIALTIAGSDSGGGAGIQADLKTFHAFGVFGTTVVTAITAQNTKGVFAVHPIPLDVVRAQMEALADDLPPAALKTGMLATAALVETIVGALGGYGGAPVVVDPVMVSSTGARLLDEDAAAALVEHLLPRAALVTPNIPEARILTGLPIEDVDGQIEAARLLVERGAGGALVKGGHASGQQLVDVLWDGERLRRWSRPRLHTRNTHGTGCTLSAAVAAGLAWGQPLPEAVDRALDFVGRAIAGAPGLGGGHGPLDLFAGTGPDPSELPQ